MSFLVRKAGRGAAQKLLAGMEPNDPHYETVTTEQGTPRKRKRDLPPGLSKRDERILRSVRRRAHYLDKGFSICGLRFGWGALFGLIPFLGDLVNITLNYFLVLRKCRKADLPASVTQRMAFNNAVAAGVGFIPLAGDIIYAVWKCNSRNAALLEEFLIERAKHDAKNGGPRGDEEVEAAAALERTEIDHRTGERVGTGGLVQHDDVRRGGGLRWWQRSERTQPASAQGTSGAITPAAPSTPPPVPQSTKPAGPK